MWHAFGMRKFGLVESIEGERRRCEDNIKVYTEEIQFERMNGILLLQRRFY